MLKEISFRLGMNGSLYLGIGIGCMISGMLFLVMLLFFDLETIVLISVPAGFIIAALFIIIITLIAQNRKRKAKENLCTCRYRSSVNTICRECAYLDRSLEIDK
ncbi:hypothetical protein [Methanospirillum hungatei]|uniref:hypothetical protein n=1 Tax=Methanospirillum hungatei TaxID=2203 RepID=UPI0026F0B624|nr:hypothetical protein [Methanospirillum hungatei]MCA1917178.1 hypothetical protein [Methanospirillum hungatei]